MPVEIPISGGYVALVDDADAEAMLRYSWTAIMRNGRATYAKRHHSFEPGRYGYVWMHREIMDAAPKDIIDHRDHNGLNNQRMNLRIATSSQNNFNSPLHCYDKKNKTGFRGVFLVASGRGYRARIKVNGRQIYSAKFNTPEEAAIAWDSLAVAHFGEFKPNASSRGASETVAVIRLTDAQQLTEWLMARTDVDEVPMIISWLEGCKSKDVIAAMRATHGTFGIQQQQGTPDEYY